MDIKKLYLRLKNAYTEENLHKISSSIISSYKNKEYEYIKNIFNKICSIINSHEQNMNKIFSKLVMLYHPDKLKFYQDQIELFYKNKNLEELNQLIHIFPVLENSKEKLKVLVDDYDFKKDFEGSYDENDFDEINEFNSGYPEDDEFYANIYEKEESDYTFLSALHLKEYGNLQVVIDQYYLETMEGDIELSNYEIEDLTGIEYCKNITSLNLSYNNLEEISRLSNLELLEEIDLSNNHINDIEVLKNLTNLKNIDLSFNKITTIKPLFELNNLEYLNIIGNKIPQDQIIHFTKKKIIVIY